MESSSSIDSHSRDIPSRPHLRPHPHATPPSPGTPTSSIPPAFFASAIAAPLPDIRKQSPPSRTMQTRETEAWHGGSGLNKGLKIGVIAAGTIIALLTLISLSLCVVGGRKRLKRRKEAQAQARANRDSELSTPDVGLRNVHQQRQSRCGHAGSQGRVGGLWDGLRVVRTDGEQLQRGEGNWDAGRVRAEQHDNGVRETEALEEEGLVRAKEMGSPPKRERAFSRESDILPVYMTRERTSILSIGSVGFPVFARALSPKSCV